MKLVTPMNEPARIGFRRRLSLGLGVILLALAGVVFFLNKNNENFIITGEWTTRTNNLLYQSEQVISLVKDVETATRGYLLSGDKRFLEPFFHGRDNIESHIAALRSLVQHDGEQLTRINSVTQTIRDRIALSERQIAIFGKQGRVTGELIALTRQGLVLMDTIRNSIGQLQAKEQELLVSRRNANEASIAQTRRLIYVVGLTIAVFLIAGWMVINRNFDARLRAEDEAHELNDYLEKRIAQRSEELIRAEQLLRHTLDNMIEGVQIIDFNWKYIYVNEALTRQSHSSNENMIGRTVMELYPGVENSELFKTLKQCMEERIPISLETEFRFPDNRSDWFELNFQPVPDGIFILSTETTRQRDAARQITEQTALAESLLSAAPDGIMGIDEHGRITMANQQAGKVFGYGQDELIGRHAGGLFVAWNEKIDAQFFQQVTEPGAVLKIELPGTRKNGQHFPVDISLSFLQTSNGKMMIGSFRDITEIKRVEAELKDLTHNLEATVQLRTSQLEAINKELDSFSYSVSHDLRAPLRAIDGYTRILFEEHGAKVGEEGRTTMETIRRSARRMGQLIDDLLAFSRLGKQSLVTAPVNMNQLVGGIVEELREQPATQVEFVINDLPDTTGDTNMLKQAVANLVSNAVKYSSKKEKARVEIGSYQENGSQIYYVSDNGAGFDMLYYDKLFGVFQRLHSTKDFEGTGVGLAIVQRIITRHGGTVWAKAEEGEGAVFYFSLPKTGSNVAG